MTELLGPIIASKAFQVASLAGGTIGLAVTIALLFWLYRDSRRRGALSYLWVGFGFILAAAAGFPGFTLSAYGFGPVGLFAFFAVLVYIVVYLIVRPVEYLDDMQERDLSIRLLEAELDQETCASCGGGIENDFLVCPSCLNELRHQCGYCGRPIKRTWRACPYCKASQGA